jgi:hypothetical protein
MRTLPIGRGYRGETEQIDFSVLDRLEEFHDDYHLKFAKRCLLGDRSSTTITSEIA